MAVDGRVGVDRRQGVDDLVDVEPCRGATTSHADAVADEQPPVTCGDVVQVDGDVGQFGERPGDGEHVTRRAATTVWRPGVGSGHRSAACA